MRALVVHLRRDEVAGEEIAHDPQGQLCLLVHERRRARTLRPGLDRLPEALQEDEVALDILGRGTLGRSADDDAALLDLEPLDDVLQPRALRVLEPARDPEPFAVRDVDQEPAGQRDLRRQPGALRLHRVLHRLHEQLLAARDQVLDLLAVMPLALELRHDDLVDVEESVLLQPDLDERRFHPRQHVVDDPEVDVPGDRAPLGPLEVDLGDTIVLDHGDALLADVDRDQQLALRGRQWRPPGRLAAALRAAALAAGSAPVGGPLGALAARRIVPRGLLRRLLGSGARCVARTAFTGRALAPTTAAAPASSLASERVCLRAGRGCLLP